ncbi:MAG: gliding motility-associated protein GldE, partial [Sediminibacterium sp.]|nr:gliding motility-associated protein GldE [Sediminibacterium sp.]
RVMIQDLCKVMDLPTETFDAVKGESDSLAGLVLELAGDFPKPAAILTSGDFEFTVLEVAKNRLQKIKVSIKRQYPI